MQAVKQHLRAGLIINPVAGIGGPVALKGSDGASLQALARSRGGASGSIGRCEAFLDRLLELSSDMPDLITWVTVPGVMGEQSFQSSAWTFATVELETGTPTTGEDTRQAAAALLADGVDILVFTGGDGTARDILAAVDKHVPVLGVPAGVKMHSGVFAVTPRTAALLMGHLVHCDLVTPVLREVRDYDEDSPPDELRVRSFGELCVPEFGGYLQHTKIGGRESEPLAVEEICAAVLEELPRNRDVVLGPGSTCLAIKHALNLSGTLRGCDVLPRAGAEIMDATAAQLDRLTAPYLVVSFTRGQGFLFGRGNQQISASFLAGLKWPDEVLIVATRTKLTSLDHRPLLLDTGNDALDQRLSGLVEIVSGYEDRLLYRLAPGGD